MRISLLIAVIVLVSTATAACAAAKLKWPEISPDFANHDPGRKLIYQRLASARDLEHHDGAQEKMLEAVRSIHGAVANESTTSKLKRVARIDSSNAIVVYDVNTNRPDLSERSLLVYPIALVGDRWVVVRSYKLIQVQFVH